MTLTLIAAVARNAIIGADGGMPWHLPADLRRFKRLTMGHPMVMGRRTFDSIGRPLPGRRTIVVTRDPLFRREGVEAVDSVAAALVLAGAPTAEVMIVGGGEIYRQTIDQADRLEITHIDRDILGDTTFPPIDPVVWEAVATEPGEGYAFVSYARKSGDGRFRATRVGQHDPQGRIDARPRGGVDADLRGVRDHAGLAGQHRIAAQVPADGVEQIRESQLQRITDRREQLAGGFLPAALHLRQVTQRHIRRGGHIPERAILARPGVAQGLPQSVT